MRRSVTGILLVFTLALSGCGTVVSAAPKPATPSVVTVPNVVGQNADVARDVLHKRGLTNVDLGTVDSHHIVVLAQNWIVKTQSAKPGSRVSADTKIVLGCARIGGKGLF